MFVKCWITDVDVKYNYFGYWISDIFFVSENKRNIDIYLRVVAIYLEKI